MYLSVCYVLPYLSSFDVSTPACPGCMLHLPVRHLWVYLFWADVPVSYLFATCGSTCPGRTSLYLTCSSPVGLLVLDGRPCILPVRHLWVYLFWTDVPVSYLFVTCGSTCSGRTSLYLTCSPPVGLPVLGGRLCILPVRHLWVYLFWADVSVPYCLQSVGILISVLGWPLHAYLCVNCTCTCPGCASLCLAVSHLWVYLHRMEVPILVCLPPVGLPDLDERLNATCPSSVGIPSLCVCLYTYLFVFCSDTCVSPLTRYFHTYPCVTRRYTCTGGISLSLPVCHL